MVIKGEGGGIKWEYGINRSILCVLHMCIYIYIYVCVYIYIYPHYKTDKVLLYT